MCLQEMEGSGFPVARHTRVTLLPSFTMRSLEIRTILGETEKREGQRCQGSCCLGTVGSPSSTQAGLGGNCSAWLRGAQPSPSRSRSSALGSKHHEQEAAVSSVCAKQELQESSREDGCSCLRKG